MPEQMFTTWDGKKIRAEIANKDANGNTIDMSAKADKVASATNGNLASLDASGNLVDANVSASVLDSKEAKDGGIDLSMVTTGEKYVWNDWKSANVVIPPKDFVNIGGRKYETKVFGNREWMMESLKYDTEQEYAMTIRDGIYYYTVNYVLKDNAELLSLLHDGWRVPTAADRNALCTLAGTPGDPNTQGAVYLHNNFNVEESSAYDGYGTFPGTFNTSWEFVIMTTTNGSGNCGAITIQKSPNLLINMGHYGGDDNLASLPLRLCRDVVTTGE